MKSLSFMSKMAMILGLGMLIVSCQKQQDAVSTDTAPTDAAVIKNVAGDMYSGKISRSEAEEMYRTYKGTAQNGSTEYVAFKIKDLQAFLASAQAKYKSDVVYVNLAVYDKNTAPQGTTITGRQLEGATTVFFSCNNLSKSRAGSNNNIAHGFLTLDDVSDYMNHGNIWP